MKRSTLRAFFRADDNTAEAPATDTSGSAPETKKAPVKKAAPKKAPAKKAPVKKAPVKKAATNGTPQVKKEGLRKPQVRILEALAKTKNPNGQMTRAEIAEKAPVDVATCVEYLGSDDPAKREANDKKHFPSLISLGHVKAYQGEEDRATYYSITASGKKALEAAKKE